MIVATMIGAYVVAGIVFIAYHEYRRNGKFA